MFVYRAGWLGVCACLITASQAAACQRSESRQVKRDPAVLDGMELTAARRVGLESAADAMERGDLKQLKMLSVWVRSRAQVILFEPVDVESLDRAIACLENPATRSDELNALARLERGVLSKPARDACQSEPE